MEKIKVLSLFCGCGGMDLGLIGGFEYRGEKYEENCFEIVQAIDNDPYCTQIYNANFEHPCEVKDVREIDIDNLPAFDMLIGGFPCQSFSISAQNPPRLGYKDERGMLFFEMVKILKAKKPRFFIAENVKGLLSANQHKAFPMIIKEFKEAGYKVRHQLLNAANYGVPQKRERVIIVGFRENEDYISFCYPTRRLGKKAVLGDVIDEEENSNEKLFFSEKAVEGMMANREKMNKGRAQSLDEPCNTISSHLAKVSLNSTDPVLLVDGRYRRFSCRETARIQSFPESFRFDIVSDSKQYKAIGNAVPPVMMWHIAKALQNIVEDGHPFATNRKPESYFSDETFRHEPIQLTLAMEPQALYLSKAGNKHLVGSCRQGNRAWIKENRLYNYPITDEELECHPRLLKVNELTIMFRKKADAHYPVESVETVTRQQLAEMGYPVKSSRHKADAKYLLYHLGEPSAEQPTIDLNAFELILGKGVKGE